MAYEREGLFKIATWNVNSLRTRLPQVLSWLAREQPGILALQEIKIPDADFPVGEFRAAGYDSLYAGQRTYNGVAMLSRRPGSDVVKELPDLGDEQRRFLGATFDGVRIINVYVPNGERVGSEKYRYKLSWLDRLTGYVQRQLKIHPRLILLGDFNVAPEERDVYDPKSWEAQVLFSEPERAAFRRLLETGLFDTFRIFNDAHDEFSWWDYRMQAFRRNRGLRIDHILISTSLRNTCNSCRIDKGPRAHERPSDHAPVVAEIKLEIPRSLRSPPPLTKGADV